MDVEFIPDDEELELDEGDAYPDTLHGPDAVAHFAGDAQVWLGYWCERMGQDIDGAVFTLGESAGIAILCTKTGQWMTPEAIIKRAPKVSGLQSVK